MAGVHTVLSKVLNKWYFSYTCIIYNTSHFVQQIPESLNFEIILNEATKMHKEYDLSNVKDEVEERVKLE